MSFLRAVWNFLKGKKTYIGAAAHVVIKGLEATGKIDPGTAKLLEGIATTVLAVGVADKVKDEFIGNREQ